MCLAAPAAAPQSRAHGAPLRRPGRPPPPLLGSFIQVCLKKDTKQTIVCPHTCVCTRLGLASASVAKLCAKRGGYFHLFALSSVWTMETLSAASLYSQNISRSIGFSLLVFCVIPLLGRGLCGAGSDRWSRLRPAASSSAASGCQGTAVAAVVSLRLPVAPAREVDCVFELLCLQLVKIAIFRVGFTSMFGSFAHHPKFHRQNCRGNIFHTFSSGRARAAFHDEAPQFHCISAAYSGCFAPRPPPHTWELTSVVVSRSLMGNRAASIAPYGHA